MGSASWAQTSFLGGEWSKSAQGRFDDPMYRKAMNVCLNTLPIVEGSTARRPGFRVGATTRGGLPAKLLPYTEATVDMELELSEGHARFFRDGKIYTNDQAVVTNISAANPGVITLANAVTWPDQSQVVVQFLDQTAAAAVPRLGNRIFLLDLITTSTFALRDAVTGMQVDCTSLGWSAGLNLQVNLVADVVTPYTGGAWANMNIVQSDKRALLVGPGQQPEVITTTSIDPVSFTDGPYLDPFPGSQVTPDALTGIVNLTLSFQPYDATVAYAPGEYVTSSSVGYISLVDLNLNNTPASSPTFWQVVAPGIVVNGGAGFGAGDAGRHVRLFSEPLLWVSATTYAIGDIVSFGGSYWTAIMSMTGTSPSVGTANPNQPGQLATTWAPNSSAAVWTWGKITNASVTTSIPGLANMAGTFFGTMTAYGGVAAPFSGAVSKAAGACAIGTADGSVGVNFASATAISSAKVYPSADEGFSVYVTQINLVTLNLRGKHTAPATPADGTLLGTSGSFLDTKTSKIIISTDLSTLWEYVWVEAVITYQGNPSYSQSVISYIQFFDANAGGSGTGFSVQIISAPLLYNSAIRTWRLGAYNNTDPAWPTCGCYHEGRFWLAGAIEGRFDASTSNNVGGDIGNVENVLDFSPTDDTGAVLDSSAISYTLNAKEAGQFVWMKSDLQGILVGTGKTELLIHASDNTNIITPTSIQAHPTTEYGTTNTNPLAAPLSSVFIHKSGKQIFEYFIAAYTRRPVGLEISTMSRHLTADTVKELAYTSRLNPTIWYRTAKNMLRAITYRRTDLMANSPPDFSAAHQHVHGNNAGIIGVCQARSVSGDKTDTLAIVAQDPITGVCTVEYMTDLPGEDLDVFHAQYLDGALVPAAVTSITGGIRFSGLHIYNGKTVTVYAAGLDLGDHVVASSVVDVLFVNADPDGILTQRYLTELQGLQLDYGDLGVPLDNGAPIPALVGFTYTSQGQVLRPIAPDATGSQSGPALGKLRRQATWSALFLNTRGLSIGTTFDKVRTILFKRNNNANLSPTELFSGAMYGNLDDATTLDSMLCWETTRPSPANIIALGGFITSDK